VIYCFKCDCGKKTEKALPISDCEKVFKCKCGKTLKRDFQAERGIDTPGTWPMESDAAGVNPEQIPEAREYARSMGVPTEYNPETGAAIFTSRDHRKRFCEASGLYDRNAGYGDQSPRHNMRKRRFRCQRTAR
jgi:hypothetical protein